MNIQGAVQKNKCIQLRICIYSKLYLSLQILIVSGGMGAVRLDSTEIFDPDLGSWSAGAALPMKYGINGLKSATIDNRVFIFGKTFFAI